MIVAPQFAADEGLRLAPVEVDALPSIPGVDLAAAIERVRGFGGDAARCTALLAAGLAAAAAMPGEHLVDGMPDAATSRTLAGIAGWRSGVTRLRDDALAHALTTPGAEAALGLGAGELARFLHAQIGDPLGWHRGARTIARLGGFRGFGGPWIEPPAEVRLVGPGILVVRTGADWWDVDADAFGARIRPRGPGAELPPSVTGPVTIAVSPESYFVTIERSTDAAAGRPA